MTHGRWYPSLIALGDGRVLAATGLTEAPTNPQWSPELDTAAALPTTADDASWATDVPQSSIDPEANELPTTADDDSWATGGVSASEPTTEWTEVPAEPELPSQAHQYDAQPTDSYVEAAIAL